MVRLRGILQWPADYGWQGVRGDFQGGIVAGILSFPPAVSYGYLTGLGPQAGLNGAIAVCLFTALFGGVNGMISGPNVVMSSAMAIVVVTYTTTLTEAFATVMLAGGFLVLFGALRFGQLVAYIPYPMISGIFTAIGYLLLTTQFFPAVGMPPVSFYEVGLSMDGLFQQMNPHAVGVSICTLGVAAVWRGQLAKVLPSQVPMLIVGTLIGVLWFPKAEQVNIAGLGHFGFAWPEVSWQFLLRVSQPAFIMALLGAITTLTIAIMLDAKTGMTHRPNQELAGNGIANLFSGLLGGNVGAVVGVSSVVNVQNGGRTRLSGVVAAMLIALVTFLPVFRTLIGSMPVATLACIVMTTGLEFFDWRLLRRVHLIGREDVLIMLSVFGATAFIDFATGVVIGFVLTGFQTARNAERQQLERLVSVPWLDIDILGKQGVKPNARFNARAGLVRFPGHATMASAREMSRILGGDFKQHEFVALDMSRTRFMDITAANMIGRLIQESGFNPSAVVFIGMSDSLLRMFRAVDALQGVPEENLVENRDAARIRLRALFLAHKDGTHPVRN